MTRLRWILGNWKQNHLPAEAEAWAREILPILGAGVPGVEVGVAPPYLSIGAMSAHVRPHSPLWLFAQDVAAQESGAFTGEVGPAMLLAAGCQGALVGHSERRQFFGDHDDLVAAKLTCALQAGLTAVLCVGESLEIRQAGNHESHVISQVSSAITNLNPDLIGPRFVIAYEPVWAIGTGHNATPEQAAAMHSCIRAFLAARLGAQGADRSILYGGSVKPANAPALLSTGEVDGFLVGGASLTVPSFAGIVQAPAAPA